MTDVTAKTEAVDNSNEDSESLMAAPPAVVPSSSPPNQQPFEELPSTIQLILVNNQSSVKRQPPEGWAHALNQRKERLVKDGLDRATFFPPRNEDDDDTLSQSTQRSLDEDQHQQQLAADLQLPSPFTQPKPSLATMTQLNFGQDSNWVMVEIGRQRLRQRLRKYSKQLEDDKRLLLRDANETAQDIATIEKITPLVMRGLRICGNRYQAKQVQTYALQRLCLCRLRLRLMRQSTEVLESTQHVVKSLLNNTDVQPEEFDLTIFSDSTTILAANVLVVAVRNKLESLNSKVLRMRSKAIQIAQCTWSFHHSGFNSPEMVENWIMGMQHKSSQATRAKQLQVMVDQLDKVMGRIKALKIRRLTKDDRIDICDLLSVDCGHMSLDWQEYNAGLDPDRGICTYRWREDFCEIQQQFDSFMNDRRFAAGKAVGLLMRKLRENPELPPAQIVGFIEVCTNNMLLDHNLDHRHAPDIVGLTQGCLFPRLMPMYFKRQVVLEQHRDSLFRKNANWLRNKTPQQLAMDSNFYSFHTSGGVMPPLHWKATTKLAEIELLTIPGDMLLCIYEAVVHIYNDVLEFANTDPSDVGADQLMPVLIFVTAHANLAFPNATLEVIKLFSTDCEIAMGELGYYLACWEGAIAYITDITETAFEESLHREGIALE